MNTCENGHLYSKFQPATVYWCPGCETKHGTSSVNGAVSWHCPKCPEANQLYLGQSCIRCGHLNRTGAKFELIPRIWNVCDRRTGTCAFQVVSDEKPNELDGYIVRLAQPRNMRPGNYSERSITRAEAGYL